MNGARRTDGARLPARTPPVVVMGMHRSGTKAVTAALARMGLYTGAHRDPNGEAWFFLRLNEWALHEAGASWDHPQPVHALLSQDPLVSLAADYLGRVVRSPRSLSYLGLRRMARARWPGALTEPWGWKDPRNTFTLPLWLRLFPDARVVHVVRHGVDVAASLERRAERSLTEHAARYHHRPWLSAWRGRSTGFVDSVRCTSMEGAFSLWEEYVSEGRRHLASLGDQAVEVRFEELAVRPSDELERLAVFCGLEPHRRPLEDATAGLDPGRARAYRRDARLAEFSAGVAGRLAVHGYDA